MGFGRRSGILRLRCPLGLPVAVAVSACTDPRHGRWSRLLHLTMGVDRRSLAMCRCGCPVPCDATLCYRHAYTHTRVVSFSVFLAAAVIADLWWRLDYAGALLSDAGVVPRTRLFMAGPGYWSLYLADGSAAFVGLMFAITAAFASCMMLGLYTRTSTFMVWLLTISLHNRNPYLQNSGDIYLLLMLLWGNFVPWGEAYSLDSSVWPRGRCVAGHKRAYEGHAARGTVVGIGIAGMLLQTVLLYLQSAVLKNGPEWRSEFTAARLSLCVDSWSLPFGQLLRDWDLLLRLLTASTVILEGPGALLLIAPLGTHTGAVRKALPARIVAQP